jgi:hypothetical protein
MIITPLLLVGCNFFKSSKELELIPYVQKEKFGYFDLEGKIVINPQFAFATAFREDIALVKTIGEKGKWGYIDKGGKFVINASYKDATVFQEGIAWVVSDNAAPSAIDKNGEIKFTLKEAEQVRLFSEDLAAFSKVDSTRTIWGFVDKSGKQIINPQFDAVGNFKDGKCSVKNKDGKWGYIDKSGKIIINYQFDDAYNFEDGKAIVYLDEKAGVIDEDGKYIINPQFQYAFIDNDEYLIYQDDKAGWCDKEGKFIINPQFDGAEAFGDNDLACIKSSDKYGYVDKDGKIMINPQFDEASIFIGDVAIVKTGDKYGLIDKKGKYIVNPQFEEIGYDVFSYLNDYSIKATVTSDFLDLEAILKVVKINNPENLSLDDNFQTILRKVNKSADDFSTYSDVHLIFENKFINNVANYSFAVMGRLKGINSYTYEYYVTEEKPTGFVYLLSLSGKAAGKTEYVQKALEKKLSSYKLMKKGYVNGVYTSVYKSDKNIVITTSQDSSNSMFYILNNDYEISFYLNKMVEKVDETPTNYDSVSVDTTAVEAVDTTGYY